MDDVSRIKCYHFGHSFVTRLSRTIEPSGQSIFSYLGLSESFNVVLQGFSGLTFDKVLSNPDRFLQQLQTQTNIDILSVDLGSNDLCHPLNTVSVTIGKVREFLQLLKERGIQPKVIVFLSVLLRTAITRTGMVDLPTFVHRARKFNRELSNEFRIMELQNVFMFSQSRLNQPKYIDDGCHLTSTGVAMYAKNLKRLILQYSKYC